MTEEWGSWIEHDGSGCPVPIGAMVHRIFDCAPISGIAKGNFEHVSLVERGEMGSWNGSGFDAQVTRYRIRKPRGMAILESLLQQTPEPVETLP